MACPVLSCCVHPPSQPLAGQDSDLFLSIPTIDVNVILILGKQGMGYNGKVIAKHGFVYSCIGTLTVAAGWWYLQGNGDCY